MEARVGRSCWRLLRRPRGPHGPPSSLPVSGLPKATSTRHVPSRRPGFDGEAGPRRSDRPLMGFAGVSL